ncbi:MAG: DUF3037 domain-containing protein [Streptosporangiaceae bacterium]
MSSEPFEYALIRVVPRVERGEAINVGVMLYSQAHQYLGCRIELDAKRLLALHPGTDLTAVTAALRALERDCREGRPAEQPLGRDSAGSRRPGARSCSPVRCTAG